MLGIIEKAFEDHYWDSLEPQKELVMLHIRAVLDLLRPSSEEPPQSGRTALSPEVTEDAPPTLNPELG